MLVECEKRSAHSGTTVHPVSLMFPLNYLKTHTGKLRDLADSFGYSAGTEKSHREGNGHIHIQFGPKDGAAKLE